MWNDAIDLRDFYRTSLGQITQRTIRNRIRATWDNVSGLTLLGFGYATPYLLPFRDEAQRVVAAMPAQQGVLHWPADGLGSVALCDETEIPLPDVSVDRVLMVHGLECSEQLRPMLREIWRVLADGGRFLAGTKRDLATWRSRSIHLRGLGRDRERRSGLAGRPIHKLWVADHGK